MMFSSLSVSQFIDNDEKCFISFCGVVGVGGGGRMLSSSFKKAFPTNNALLINFVLSSDAEILLNKHRLSIQKCACNVYASSN